MYLSRLPAIRTSLVDASRPQMISRLAQAVSIQSVSADLTRRKDIVRMVEWTKQHLERLGASCELCPLPSSALILPPVLFGSLGTDPNKKTLLVYCHLDVQPAKKEDGWTTDPFVLTEVDGKLFGRGSTDDKGPVVSWINAIEMLQKVGQPIPVNIKFVFEGMEESGSAGLEDLLRKRTDFMAGIDYVCVSDGTWLSKDKPSITYGLRGLCNMGVEVSSPSPADSKSGGLEPMTDLVWLMSQLITDDGKPNIPKLAEMVRNVDEKELKKYESLDFDVQQYRRDLGVSLCSEDKTDVLMRRWRFPSLSLHGIEGAFSKTGDSYVIPSSVTGKFSIRLVPDMKPKEVEEVVVEHLNNLWKARNTNNTLRPFVICTGKPWLTDPDSPNHRAAHRAIHKVYGVEPDYARGGSSVPITTIFEEITGLPVLILIMGGCDDNPHAQNEKLNVRNYVHGTKLYATYLVELGSI